MSEPEEDAGNEVPISARRTESLDAPSILKLVSQETHQIFGRVNIVQLIEKANLAISLVDERNEILGHAAFFDYPPGRHADQCNWEKWLKSHHDISQSTPVNTLFLHFFVSKPDFSHGSLSEIMRTMFNAVPLLTFVILVVPNDATISGGMARLFEPLESKKGIDTTSQNHRSYICYRYNHCPVLYIRSARVEDHDDLMPIFNRHNTELTAMYGDFFLSDLIEAEDDENKSIVADVDGTAVGFVSLCTDVNVDILNKCFELQPFNGLKSTPRKELQKKDAAVETISVKMESPIKSRPTTGFSVTIKTDEAPASPSLASTASPIQKSGAAETPGLSVSSLSPVDKRGKSPVAKGSFHRTKQKSAKGVTPKAAAPAKKKEQVKVEIATAPDKPEEKENHEDQPRAESEMTIKTDKDGPTEKQREVEEEATNEHVEEEAEPVESVLSIQLFCIDEKFEMRSMDFLPKIFELFPDKDYCVITIPHTVPEFPLLQSFKRATPRPESTISQELYVFNRNGLLSSLKVRPSNEKDVVSIEKLVKSIQGKEHLLKDVHQYNDARRDADGTEIKCYVMECMDQVIGVSVLRREEDIEYIRAHYNIEDFVYFNHHEREEHGHLHHFALNPAFSHHSKHFLKEVLRLSRKSCLYYPLYQSMPSSELVKAHSLVTCLSDLVPIRPRRQIIYPVKDLGINAPSDRILKKQKCFSLYHMNRKLTLEPKVVINVRIVVVGASDVGLSCLDALVNCPHLCFNNLTLVSKNGLQLNDIDEGSSLRRSLCFSQKELDAMSLSTWINVVTGKMTKIDRVNKSVITSDGREVPYDHLLLCTGEQFQYPVPTGADITELVTTSEALQQKLPKVYKGFIPDGVFPINNKKDLKHAKMVEDDILTSQGDVVVYGSTLEAYSFIEKLLSWGVEGGRIVFVKPPMKTTSCFNNPDLQKIIENSLNEKGVVTHDGYTLAQWNDGEEDSTLRCSTFTSESKPLRVECKAFVCLQEKRVDYDAFKAFNDSCLVYDGRLVIDSNFRTNDNFIRAAGSATKYARRYHADSWTHSKYNSREVGVRLAESMLSMFDPTLEEAYNSNSMDEKLIPDYRKPKLCSAILPGGYEYLHVGKPCLAMSLEDQMTQPDYGQVLLTNSEEKGVLKYFRLHLNQYNAVETITCLSNKPMDIENLICLFGIHERYLNNLVERYNEGLITDLFTYFQESWSLAVFHDRFSDFRAEIHEILAEREAESVISLEEKVRKLIEEDLVLSKDQRDVLADTYVASKSKKLIEQRLLSYLSYNNYHLPMYARPGMV